MFALVHFYRECIRLENFAVINYQGFSKVPYAPVRVCSTATCYPRSFCAMLAIMKD